MNINAVLIYGKICETLKEFNIHFQSFVESRDYIINDKGAISRVDITYKFYTRPVDKRIEVEIIRFMIMQGLEYHNDAASHDSHMFEFSKTDASNVSQEW